MKNVSPRVCGRNWFGSAEYSEQNGGCDFVRVISDILVSLITPFYILSSNSLKLWKSRLKSHKRWAVNSLWTVNYGKQWLVNSIRGNYDPVTRNKGRRQRRCCSFLTIARNHGNSLRCWLVRESFRYDRNDVNTITWATGPYHSRRTGIVWSLC